MALKYRGRPLYLFLLGIGLFLLGLTAVRINVYFGLASLIILLIFYYIVLCRSLLVLVLAPVVSTCIWLMTYNALIGLSPNFESNQWFLTLVIFLESVIFVIPYLDEAIGQHNAVKSQQSTIQAPGQPTLQNQPSSLTQQPQVQVPPSNIQRPTQKPGYVVSEENARGYGLNNIPTTSSKDYGPFPPPTPLAPKPAPRLETIIQDYRSGQEKYEVSLGRANQLLCSGGSTTIKEFLDLGSGMQDSMAQSLIVDALVNYALRGASESNALIDSIVKTQLSNKDFKWLVVQGLGRLDADNARTYLDGLMGQGNEDYIVKFWAGVGLSQRKTNS